MSSTTLCQKCQTTDQSEPCNWCSVCNEYICENCAIDHLSSESTMEHDIVPANLSTLQPVSTNIVESTSYRPAYFTVPEIIFEKSVNIEAQAGNVVVTDMVSVGKDKVLLCNASRSTVLVYHNSGIHLTGIKIDLRPHRIAVIPGTLTAVVKFKFYKWIQFIDTERNAAGKVVKLQTENNLHGLSATKDNLLLGTSCEVLVFNFEGHLIKTLKLPSSIEFNTPHYIHLSHFDSFYYTTHTRLCLSRADGSNVFYVCPNDMISPQKAVTDLYGNVYVADVVDNKVVRVSRLGYSIDVPVAGVEIRRLYAICFNPEKTLLFVANNLGRDLRVFRIKYKEEI